MISKFLTKKNQEKFILIILQLITWLVISILAMIILYIFYNGIKDFKLEFILDSPKDMGREGGIFPQIIATFYLAGLSILFALPLGIGTAIYLTEYTTEGKLTNIIRFGVDCLAGIPSIIFGLFGFVLFVIYLKLGWCLLSGALTMTFMILPVIVRTTEEAIKAVPYEFREISYSLGATKWQTIYKIILPESLPGIMTGIVLSLGRIIGETAVVIFTLGSALNLPASIFESARTLSVHFYIIAREGISIGNAFKTALVIICVIITINLFAYFVLNKMINYYKK